MHLDMLHAAKLWTCSLLTHDEHQTSHGTSRANIPIRKQPRALAATTISMSRMVDDNIAQVDNIPRLTINVTLTIVWQGHFEREPYFLASELEGPAKRQGGCGPAYSAMRLLPEALPGWQTSSLLTNKSAGRCLAMLCRQRLPWPGASWTSNRKSWQQALLGVHRASASACIERKFRTAEI